MNKWIKIGIVLVVVFIIYRMFAGTYNNMVMKNEEVVKQWAQVENVYQRRADLIPNLVNTVKGYASHEQETFTKVIEARAKATQVTVDPQNLSASQIQQFQSAQGELSSALGRLMVVIERYPDLKANQNFLELQAQLEGTENRISVERKKFNETTQSYNTYVKKFPQTMLAGMFGFSEKAYFESQAGAEQAPQVEF